MSQCWSEGALRTYLDRELPQPDMELVAAHLAECAECAGMSRNLAARAARVAVWMEALPEPEIAAPRRATARRRWMGLAAAIAAGLAVAAMVLPRHKDVVAAPAPSVVLAPPAAVVADAAAPSAPRITAVAAAPRRIRQPKLRLPTVNNRFLALDDEPIETGVIMRVGVEPGNVQADIVFGQDGRAHAIRLVNARN
ncbi:MAG TPA: zf-HC2 domain-containing protein [Candidatus Solibacter sp.]|nr:zf-HC2 domain-containing protein [Candidatus Solibacter sp.]